MQQTIENYYPSNSSDGDYFFSLNCINCYKKANCSIWNRALIGIKPTQWIYNHENKPVCTSFQKDRPAPKTTFKPNEPRLF